MIGSLTVWLVLVATLDVTKVGEDLDKVVWSLEPSKSFSTKSTLQKLFNVTPRVKVSLLNLIWKGDFPKKVKVFLWSLVYRSLNTHERLQKKKVFKLDIVIVG